MPAIGVHTIVADIQRDVSKIREDTGGQNQAVGDIRMFRCSSIHSRLLDSEQVSDSKYQETQHLTFVPSMPGELPPPPPRTFLGRAKLIEKVVHLAERLTPIALIGAGGDWKNTYHPNCSPR